MLGMQPRRPSRDGPASDDERAAARLVAGDLQRRLRRFWRSWPTAPRCKLCHRPFAGPGGRVMRLVGLGPWPGNPTYCRGCFRALYRDRAGAEISCALLFADVRDSTAMAEGLRPAEFRRRMDRFYATACEVLDRHDAFVDKFVGDEVVGDLRPGPRRWIACSARRSMPGSRCCERPATAPTRRGLPMASASTPGSPTSARWGPPSCRVHRARRWR